MTIIVGHHDIQHNDIQHNDIQHKGFICDTQHNNALQLCWVSIYRESHFLYQMLNVIILSVIMLNVVMLNVVMLSVVAPTIVISIGKMYREPTWKIAHDSWPITPPPPPAPPECPQNHQQNWQNIHLQKGKYGHLGWQTQIFNASMQLYLQKDKYSGMSDITQMEPNLFVLHHAWWPCHFTCKMATLGAMTQMHHKRQPYHLYMQNGMYSGLAILDATPQIKLILMCYITKGGQATICA